MSASTALNLGCLGSTIVNVPTQKPLLLPGTMQSLPFLASPNHLPKMRNSNCSWRNTTSISPAVAAVETSDLADTQESQTKRYHFVIANAKFMLDEEEHFQELMFERIRLFGERGKEQDFWLVIEPKFLDKFPDIAKRLKRPAVALVSTNGTWITFMKLRLDRVLQESYEADSLEEALASNPATLEFEKPDKWVAPYPKYEFGWWETFLPSGSETATV